MTVGHALGTHRSWAGNARTAESEEPCGVDALRMHMNANELFASVGEPGGTGYAPSRASLSAFGLGDYSEALRLARAGYNALAESNHRWGLIVALCRIGFAALALGDLADARERFGGALRERRPRSQSRSSCSRSAGSARASPRIPAEQERAAAILTFVMGHEQLPPSYAFAARPALDRLEAELPPDQLAAAREVAAVTTLEEFGQAALQPLRS